MMVSPTKLETLRKVFVDDDHRFSLGHTESGVPNGPSKGYIQKSVVSGSNCLKSKTGGRIWKPS